MALPISIRLAVVGGSDPLRHSFAVADRNAGREGFVATRRWREAPEGIRT